MEGPVSTAPARPGSHGLPWLLADIGGTNARFGWVDASGAGVQHVHTLPVAAFPGPAEAAGAYLEHLRQAGLEAAATTPRRAAMAVATAVQGDEVALTNSPWRFSRAALQRSLGVERLLVLNDFEGLALSLPKLQPHQVRAIGAPTARDDSLSRVAGTMAVIGPGTGLGVGGVVPTAHGWVALPGEGGHGTLAPMDDFEGELLRHVRRDHAHVSAERLLSGIGLPVLHDAVAAVLGHNVPPQSAETIVEQGTSGQDPLCRFTLDTFCALLGGFAGNVALTLGARGGVYVGGGIVPRFGERFFESRFRERFVAKGRAGAYLDHIPTTLIIDTLAALTGGAFALEQLES
ncbi:MAG: glucokinase [Rubrivivax sp.]|nr:glucokinase [Rubrivivax sp.]